jgi:DNA-directed RNA polymerase specialized sigma24 family protein
MESSNKRGRYITRVELDHAEYLLEPPVSVDILALAEALNLLEIEYPELSRVVFLILYSGMTYREVADFLGISEMTVRRNYEEAKKQLKEILKPT